MKSEGELKERGAEPGRDKKGPWSSSRKEMNRWVLEQGLAGMVNTKA